MTYDSMRGHSCVRGDLACVRGDASRGLAYVYTCTRGLDVLWGDLVIEGIWRAVRRLARNGSFMLTAAANCRSRRNHVRRGRHGLSGG
eukprot:2417010-Prymnesium_polylepis.2